MKHTLTIIFFAALAILASCNKKNEPENSDAPQNDETSGTVKDICGNTYNYVKIGEQYWMTENMRCNKYDTQSERKGETLSTSEIGTYAPYYTDASDKSKWDPKYDFSENLSDEQISKLGFLYNWAAAVGIATAEEAESQIEPFSGNRQGICPNGWHVPTNAEVNTLIDYVGINAGRKLKTTSGWHENGNGIDSYSYAALPAGKAGIESGSAIRGVGRSADFWTATPFYHDQQFAKIYYTESEFEFIIYGVGSMRQNANSVRCIKD